MLRVGCLSSGVCGSRCSLSSAADRHRVDNSASRWREW